MINTDLISGLLVLGLSGLAWIQSRAFSYYGGVFVDWVLLLLFGLGIALVIKGCINWRIKKENLKFCREKGSPVIRLLFSLVLYFFLLPQLGFLLSSIIILPAISLMLTPGEKRSPRNWLVATGLGLTLTIVFYVIFKYGLLVPLPVGAIWLQ